MPNTIDKNQNTKQRVESIVYSLYARVDQICTHTCTHSTTQQCQTPYETPKLIFSILINHKTAVGSQKHTHKHK